MNDVFQSANPVTAPFGDGVRTAAAGAEGSLEASFHFFDAGGGLHVLVVDGSQIYAIDDELRLAINGAVVGGPAKIALSWPISELSRRASWVMPR